MWKTRWKVWITLGDGRFPRGDGGELCLRLFCIKDAETGWPAGEDPRPSVRKGGIKMQERRRPMQGRRRGYGSWTDLFGSEELPRRAARCAASTEPHPPRFARHLPLKGKAFRRPQGSPLRRHPNVPGGRVWDPPLRRIQNGCIFLVGAGHWPALQWKPDRDVSSKNSGAETRPQLLQFPSYPGPQWGWMGPHPSTPDSARRKFYVRSKR